MIIKGNGRESKNRNKKLKKRKHVTNKKRKSIFKQDFTTKQNYDIFTKLCYFQGNIKRIKQNNCE